MQETLGRRITIGYGVVLALFGATILVSYRSLTQSHEDTRGVSHTHAVLERLTLLLLQTETLEGKQRSYLLTGEEHFAHSALAAVPAIRQTLSEIQSLTTDNPRQQERLGAVKPLVEARIALAVNTIEIYRREGFAAAQQKVLTGEGSRLTANVERGVREMESEEQTLLAAREVEAATSARRTIGVLLVSGLSSLLLVIVAGLQVRRELGARLRADTVLRQSHEELEHRVRERTGELARTNEQLQSEIDQRRQAEEQLRKSLARLQLLTETSQAFAGAGLGEQGLFDRVVQKITEALGDAGYLYLLSDDEQSMSLNAMHAVEPEARAVIRELVPLQLRMDEPGLTSQAHHSGQPIFSPIVNMDDLRAAINPQWRALVEQYGTHSGIIVPLRTQGRGIGALILGRYRGEQAAFTEEDLRLAQDLVDRAALAITNARLYHNLQQELAEHQKTEQRMQQQLGQLALLHELTRAIGEHQDLASIFLTVLGRLESDLPVAFAALLLWDPQEARLQVHTVGLASRALAADVALTEQAVIPVDPNGLRQAFNGQTVSEPDTAQSLSPFPQRMAQAGLRSLVLAPLQAKAEVVGVLVVARREVGSFSSGECEFLRQLSEHVALAVRQVQLHTEVRQAYDELRQTQHVLVQQERLRALGQMASGIAHDINNAMTPASLYVQDLVSHEAGLSPEGRDALVVVQTAISDVAQTVARLREFYRKPDPSEELLPLDINALVRQSVELTRARWRDQAQRQGIAIRLEMQLQEKVPAVKGNESEVRELLVNLILNAVDAMPQGGELVLTTQAMPTTVAVIVRDTGVGMDEETKQRCIEPFYTTKGERGTGLGLAMVYGVVQRHGGKLEIESEEGVGTTVRVVWPYAAELAGVPGAAAGEAREVPMLRILLIDDEPLICKAVGDVLRRWGHEVVNASSGEEGVAVFRTAGEQGQWFDVVITDLGMPKMDGKEVARVVKELAPRTPVIMLTGWGQQLSSTGERTPHVDVLLSKPPQLTDLRAALETVIGSG